MKSNVRILGAVMMGVGAVLLTCCVQGVKQQRHKRVAKKMTKEAFQAWEGEGGTIVEPTPRPGAV